MRLLKRLIFALLLLVVLAFGVLFSIQNGQKAGLDLLLVQLPEQRIALWVFLAFALGGLLGLVAGSMAWARLKGRVMLLQRRLDKQEQELTHLRVADVTAARLPGSNSTSKKTSKGLSRSVNNR